MTTLLSSMKRPMAKASQVSVFRREIKEKLSPAGMELLLQTASAVSEGQVNESGHYFGSTMLTIDLTKTTRMVRDHADVATAHRLIKLLEKDEAMLSRIKELAINEARRRARTSLRKIEADVQLRYEGARIFVDVDVEGIAKTGAAPTPKKSLNFPTADTQNLLKRQAG